LFELALNRLAAECAVISQSQSRMRLCDFGRLWSRHRRRSSKRRVDLWMSGHNQPARSRLQRWRQLWICHAYCLINAFRWSSSGELQSAPVQSPVLDN
jgi:hypothetical protein